MKSKTKYKLLKIFSFITIPIFLILISVLFVLLGVSELWGDMFDSQITSFAQWSTLILYRVLIYILPATIFSLFKFDKRYSFSSRLIIWFNRQFFIYLVAWAIINFFAINLIFGFEIFSSLDAIIALSGYIFTYIKKKPVEFDSIEAIIAK